MQVIYEYTGYMRMYMINIHEMYYFSLYIKDCTLKLIAHSRSVHDIVLCVYERFRVDGWKCYVNDDRLRVDGDKNMRLLAFAFTSVCVYNRLRVDGAWNSALGWCFTAELYPVCRLVCWHAATDTPDKWTCSQATKQSKIVGLVTTSAPFSRRAVIATPASGKKR